MVTDFLILHTVGTSSANVSEILFHASKQFSLIRALITSVVECSFNRNIEAHHCLNLIQLKNYH